MNKSFTHAGVVMAGLLGLLPALHGETKKPAAATPPQKAAAPAPTVQKSAPQAPAAPGGSVKQIKEGELTAEIRSESKMKLPVGKFDPPAAFNLEDIQNFPEDRLHPVLNNPLTFDEGRDFSTMMDFQDEQLYHPWLAELSKAPYLSMKTSLDKPAKDWTFSIIDQAGGTIYRQDGKGNPPAVLTWMGQDSSPAFYDRQGRLPAHIDGPADSVLIARLQRQWQDRHRTFLQAAFPGKKVGTFERS
jgi:hypothetical protein